MTPEATTRGAPRFHAGSDVSATYGGNPLDGVVQAVWWSADWQCWRYEVATRIGDVEMNEAGVMTRGEGARMRLRNRGYRA